MKYPIIHQFQQILENEGWEVEKENVQFHFPEFLLGRHRQWTNILVSTDSPGIVTVVLILQSYFIAFYTMSQYNILYLAGMTYIYCNILQYIKNKVKCTSFKCTVWYPGDIKQKTSKVI